MVETDRDLGRALWLWGPVAAWAGLIFYLSHLPSLDTGWGTWDLALRKTAHVTEYAVLAGLLWRAWRPGGASSRVLFWRVLVVSVLYAASDEFHQSFVPGRHCSALDVAIDAAGALGLCLWRGRTG